MKKSKLNGAAVVNMVKPEFHALERKVPTYLNWILCGMRPRKQFESRNFRPAWSWCGRQKLTRHWKEFLRVDKNKHKSSEGPQNTLGARKLWGPYTNKTLLRSQDLSTPDKGIVIRTVDY